MHASTFSLPLQAVHSRGQHSISFTLSRNQTVVVEYCHDNNTDMFQVNVPGNSREQTVILIHLAAVEACLTATKIPDNLPKYAVT